MVSPMPAQRAQHEGNGSGHLDVSAFIKTFNKLLMAKQLPAILPTGQPFHI
jgi:hypothetical protein